LLILRAVPLLQDAARILRSRKPGAGWRCGAALRGCSPAYSLALGGAQERLLPGFWLAFPPPKRAALLAAALWDIRMRTWRANGWAKHDASAAHCSGTRFFSNSDAPGQRADCGWAATLLRR